MVADGCASRRARRSYVKLPYSGARRGVIKKDGNIARRAGPEPSGHERCSFPFSMRCREPYLARGDPRSSTGPRSPVPPRRSKNSSLTRCSRMYGNVARRAATGVRSAGVRAPRSGPAVLAAPIMSAHLCIYSLRE